MTVSESYAPVQHSDNCNVCEGLNDRANLPRLSQAYKAWKQIKDLLPRP